ncbi:MAG TPA: hypothetical protein VFD92_21080 [Candidatus Binatia bacterium]|nr:hypothetical protein [Candidatus Binatia bacterium]
MSRRARVMPASLAAASLPLLAALLLVAARPASAAGDAAAKACRLPARLGFGARQDPTGNGGSEVVVTASAGDAQVAAGDVVRQANGIRVARCEDLERAASAALGARLAVLLAVQRQGRLVALAAGIAEDQVAAWAPAASLPGSTSAVAPAGASATVGGIDGAHRTNELGISPPASWPGASTSGDVAAAPPAPPPIAARPPALASLPSAASAPVAGRNAAREAAAALARLEPVAHLGIPLPLYASRVRAAEAEVARTVNASDTPAGVRSAVDAILEYYRLAGEILRTKHEWVEDKGSEAAVRTVNIPYLSTSRVPRWLAEYPFLAQTAGSAPHAGLLGGEQSGSWNPDQAAELLWERARDDTADLAAWGTSEVG